MRSIILIAASLIGSASSAHAATVAAASAQPTFIAQLVAGQSYTVSVSGSADLNVYYGEQGLSFSADGHALDALPGVLAAFNTGTDIDPTTGLHAKANAFAFGSLVGSFNSNPGQGDYFALRDGMTLQAASNLTLFGLINDSAYGDNSGGYEVGLNTTAPVPEPATWAMMIVGFGLCGSAMRRRPATTMKRRLLAFQRLSQSN